MTQSFQAFGRRSNAVVAVALCAVLTLNLTAKGDQQNPPMVRLQRGQVLEFTLVTPLDSGHATVGDGVMLKLARPLIASGYEVLPADFVIYGRITKVVRAGKNCEAGRIGWEYSSVTTPGGKSLKLQSVAYYVAKPYGEVLDQVVLDAPSKKTGRAAGKIVDGIAIAPLLVLFSPLLVFMIIGMSGEGGCDASRGSDATIPAGTFFYAAVSRNVDVKVH